MRRIRSTSKSGGLDARRVCRPNPGLPARHKKDVPIRDVKSIDQASFDLSVKNPNKADETELRDPKDIIAEMVALDAESAEILAGIGRML